MKRSVLEIIVDSFAGGGGASEGISEALGRGPDIAINHSPAAIKMHAANHPKTRHYTEDVFKLSPRAVTGGKPVGLLWASPDCKHFSRAKGGKPVEKRIRGLAWSVIKWAVEVAPRVIVLENVREFEDWGPLLPQWECKGCNWNGTEGQAILGRGGKRRCPRCDSAKLIETEHKIPDPARKGRTFKQFVGRLKAQGYVVSWRTLNAADFGAPTHRRRLFLIARNDGKEIIWPDQTHGDPKKIGKDLWNSDLLPWRTAAECIDWSIPCPSIFDRKKPLKEKTLKRIAMGIKRYVLDNPKPFIVTVTHSGERRSQSVDEPLPTVTGANRGEFAAIVPHLTKFHNGCVGSDIEEPVPTVTANSYIKRPGGSAPIGVATAFVAHLAHGAKGDEVRASDAKAPLPTLHAGGGNCAVVAPVLYPRNGEFPGQRPRCQSVENPLNAVTTDGNCGQLATAILVGAGGPEYAAKPREIDRPVGALTAEPRAALVSAFIAKHYGGVVGHDPDRPLGTVTAVDHHSAVAANLIHLNHGDKQWSGCDDPARTVTTGNHAALVYSFLVKYFGTAIGVEVDSPMPTATGKDRFGLVTVDIDGEPFVIVDIGMRMLKPRELARAQGFPDTYILTGTATNQVERIGNSVSPAPAKAIVKANVKLKLIKILQEAS